jgi:hypothetical protein
VFIMHSFYALCENRELRKLLCVRIHTVQAEKGHTVLTLVHVPVISECVSSHFGNKCVVYHHYMAVQLSSGLGLPCWGFVTINFLRGWIVSPRPTPNLEDQVSVFMIPGDRVVQLYPQALGTNFSRLLRRAWVTVGLF